ncbi:MAG: alcohol dehydrogenase [Bacteroidetes bacterium]|nr:MAG: alcohol dehydrogenase [Bacteroidota bacterium]
MKALVVGKNKELSILDLPDSQVSDNEVRVKLHSAALNKRDHWISIGKYPDIKDGIVLGSDGAGIIDQVGEGVSKTWMDKAVIINPNIDWGDNADVQGKDYNILGMPTNGTFAEYVVVNIDRITAMPNHLTFEEAASLPLAGMTAFRACFHHGMLDSSKKVLISGFGGGVAHFAFLFASATGAEVSITSSRANNLQKAKELGAKSGFNYLNDDWIQEASLHDGGYDLIIDSAGGEQFNNLIKILNPGGKIVFYGASNGLPTSLDLYRLFWKQGTIQGSTMANDFEFSEMVKFIEEHKITPMICIRYPFEQIINAIKQLGNTGMPGKTVIVF